MRGKVTIAAEICKGCGLCTVACPQKIMVLNTQKINQKGYNPAEVTDMDKCIACAMCAMMCPDSAITVEKGE